MSEKIHIGKLIQEKVKEKGCSVTWFAKQVSCHRTNIYKIYQKPHIHILQLAKISDILNYDFLSHYPEYNAKKV